jgi:hypothetical protein
MQKDTQCRALFSIPKQLIDRFRLFAAEMAALPEPQQHEQAPNGKQTKSSKGGSTDPDTTGTQPQQLAPVPVGAGQGGAGETGAAAGQGQEQRQEKEQKQQQESQLMQEVDKQALELERQLQG